MPYEFDITKFNEPATMTEGQILDFQNKAAQIGLRLG